METARLVLRRPGSADAEAIFSSYASDPEVTRYLAWPRHVTIEATHRFLEFSHQEWTRGPAGPYVIEDRSSGRLLGIPGWGSPGTASSRSPTRWRSAREDETIGVVLLTGEGRRRSAPAGTRR